MPTYNKNRFWLFISLPILLYLLFIFFVHEPSSPSEPSLAEWIRSPQLEVKLYIRKHASIAKKEMRQHRIPASITLAQAVLESQYGTSELAQNANNHFGIKADNTFKKQSRHCLHSQEWHADIQELRPILSCFRKYKKVAQGYTDHSLFLVERKWYAPLFELPILDYQAWAKGLQKAGYATDPLYAQKLVSIIENYNLAALDKEVAKE